MPVPAEAPTSAIRVHDALRAAILEGEIAPGARLRAEALAERFGTSRTPIREALLMLEREGLVSVEPHRGAIVRSFDPADLLRVAPDGRGVVSLLHLPELIARAAREARVENAESVGI